MLNITKINISLGPFHAISPYFAKGKVAQILGDSGEIGKPSFLKNMNRDEKIRISKWLISMVNKYNKSPKDRVVPLPSGLNGL